MFCHTIMAGGKLEVGTWHIVCTVCLLFNLYAYCTRPWCWERQDDMASWHHQLNGHEFEQTLGDNKGQGSLACCSPWCRRVGHNWATEQHKYLYSLILFLFPLTSDFLANSFSSSTKSIFQIFFFLAYSSLPSHFNETWFRVVYSPRVAVPNLFGTGDRFPGRFFHC